MDVPAISVIIPMYNAGNYISECLDSLLEQTFQDFEVIVVDDCSTDDSFAIVGGYSPKFNGRLQLAQTEQNSGGGGYIPRNIGLSLAQGEYVFFMDADDFILLTALETLYNAAKEYDADVVYNSTHYWLTEPNKISVKRDRIGNRLLEEGIEDEPTLIVDDTDKILQDVLLKDNHRTPWTKLILRKLLIENEITFPKIVIGGDALWTILVYANSKRFLRLPTAIYFLRRYHESSLIKVNRPKTKYDFQYAQKFAVWLETFSEMSLKIEFLRTNFELCCQTAKDYFAFFVKFLDNENKQICLKDTKDVLSHKLPEGTDLAGLAMSFLDFIEEQRRMAELMLPPLRSNPAVSVIISLYNYEKYIGECLDSLLAQTLKSFEVIVVDDCSTDDSFAIVESYTWKFNGRLKLTKTEENTGGGGVPRNIGLELSSGKYVFFMDADDVLTETGLAEMYNLGKKFDADVVYCEKYFVSEGVGQEFKNNIRLADKKCQKPPFVSVPTLETTDLVKRIRKAIKFNYCEIAWLRLVRRDLLIENNIRFLPLIGSNDVGWVYQVLFCAKKFLRIPNICYVKRIHNESISFRELTTSEYIHKSMDVTIRNLKYMDTFMNGLDFFKNKPKLRYKILSHFKNVDFDCIAERCEELEPSDVYYIFRQKFGEYLGDQDVLISCLCADINTKLKNIRQDEKHIAELTNEIQRLKSKKFLAVSVIIPMYNAERYIGECLDSIFAQTFQNFEVIVVDDCSTDNSVAIVESYAQKFEGRLKLAKTKTNSGGGGYVPRNIGLNLSHGEYVYFVDADDFILLTALETLYTAAKKHDADVVYASAYFALTKPKEIQAVKDSVDLSEENSENASPLTIDDPNKNLQSLLFDENMPASWRKFLRRDFLIENEILFPEVLNGGDFIWTINVYCHAKKFLRIPSPLYFYRSYNSESVLRKQREYKEQISYWVSSFVVWAKSLSELSNRIDILKENPSYCYRALDLKFKWCSGHISPDLKGLYAKDVYEILYSGFAEGNDSLNLIASFFFTERILQKRRNLKLKKRITDLENEIKRLKGRND